MPILVALIVVIALIYGAVRAFFALQAAFGLAVAVGVAVVVALLLVGAMVYGWRRRQAVAPNIHDGDWTHELTGNWGSVRLAAGKRLCEIRIGGDSGDYIFADLAGAEIREQGAAYQLNVKVKDAKHSVWALPMLDKRQAEQWKRIFLLAVEQKL
ncbi:hypothetical protein AAGS40_05510 [Paraburkholderia sp. PREW-6R]|uniref:hypothetical protein n=1 Tax=Paraburkholderia sp. PREW-6R TaxID=3141544 RepID=UPI0031F4D6B5